MSGSYLKPKYDRLEGMPLRLSGMKILERVQQLLRKTIMYRFDTPQILCFIRVETLYDYTIVDYVAIGI